MALRSCATSRRLRQVLETMCMTVLAIVLHLSEVMTKSTNIMGENKGHWTLIAVDGRIATTYAVSAFDAMKKARALWPDANVFRVRKVAS